MLRLFALSFLPIIVACATPNETCSNGNCGGALDGSSGGNTSGSVGIVLKQTAVLPSFQFASGAQLDLKIGFETYGTLDATMDNVILLAPFLAGHSHAAGLYTASDPAPGWWDALIGPGRAIDTNKWFVVSTDAISLPRSKPTNVVTPGPASLDASGNVYGPDFPQIAFIDQVNAQSAILAQLGVTHVHAVLGASMGGIISWQWGVSYPDFVDKVIPVAAPITYSTEEVAGLDFSRMLIESDPSWNGGWYYGTGMEPDTGVGAVLAILNGIIVPSPISALANINWSQIPTQYAALMNMTPDQLAAQIPSFQTYVDEAQQGFDANNFVYTLQEFEGYDVASQFTASAVRFVAIGFQDDQLVPPDHLEAADQALTAVGASHTIQELPGGNGHLSCLYNTQEFAPIIAAELD